MVKTLKEEKSQPGQLPQKSLAILLLCKILPFLTRQGEYFFCPVVKVGLIYKVM
jgi:hypothetical protein